MASLRDIRNRINSVQNTQQVTRAMKMVAAAKLRRAQDRILATRPYAYKLGELISHLSADPEADPQGSALFEQREAVGSALIVVVTADRGLAGAFNANAIKLAEQTIRERYADLRKQGGLYLLCIGRKGHEHFAKRGYQLVGDYRGAFDDVQFSLAREVADLATDGFREGRFDEVTIVYNEFKNTISQNRVAEPLLPIPQQQFMTPLMEESPEVDVAGTEQEVDYLFEPSASEILGELVPRFLRFQVWRALLESNASEQGARMVAMDNATNNATDLLGNLKLQYNRARQSAITTEIIEITSGANALENA